MNGMVRGLALGAVLALGGCSTMGIDKVEGDQQAWGERQGTLAPLDEWQLEGRVAIDAGRDGYSGSLSWDQDGEALDFRFKGPFGMGGLRIWGGADALTVKTHKGETFTVTDPERDFGARLGWSLPIRSMRYWMAGIPAPGAEFAAEVDGRGRPLRLAQQGWTVTYAEYQTVGALELPRRLEMVRDDVKIKVIAERWTFKGGAGPAVDDDDSGMDL
jgi:outer membrane lipoprotein LolB